MLANTRLFRAAAASIIIGLTVMPVSATTVRQDDEALDVNGREANRVFSSAEHRCDMPQGWDQVAQRHTKFVVFGEVHGTREAPAFVGKVACALSERGERILIAVEHHAIYNSAFQSAWDMREEDFEAAVRKAGWAERDDGVGSEAMMGLLVYLHSLKQQGKSIDIVAFNGAKDDAQGRKFRNQPGQGPHEAAQAENIRIAAQAKPYDHVLVLVGNLHARKLPVENGHSSFKPMVMQLARPEAITALDMKTSGGTHWDCTLKPGVTPEPGKPFPADAIQCISGPLKGDSELKRAPFISLVAVPTIDKDKSFDGFFWLGSVSASPPAVPRP